ncbi:MAG: hypothetical protein LCH67_05905 [Bacteroidetes bacterium]|nr:hypothetical protein [Bacteroidota bacterium]
MPNHVHGIIELTEDRYIEKDQDGSQGGYRDRSQGGYRDRFQDGYRDGSQGDHQGVVRAEDFLPQPTPQPIPLPTPQPIPTTTTSQQTRRSIGSIVKGFKIGVTKWIRQNTNTQTVWQRNYYEIIIRNEQAFYNISNYIANNPRNWKEDKFHGR